MKKIVEAEQMGTRLDVFLCSPELSRSHVKKMIEKNKVTINGMPPAKAGVLLKEGDVVDFFPLEVVPLSLEPEDVDFEIVFEDDDLVVVNKPSGIVVHPAGGSESGTLVNGLLKRIKNLSGIGGVIRPGIVHRLDKNTSGLLVVAKNDFSHANLSKQIATKECKRTYLAILDGVLKKESGTIVTQIEKNQTHRKKMRVCLQGGKEAITHFTVIKPLLKHTLCQFDLETGRTHQIRVHAKHMGHPVSNDDVYGQTSPRAEKQGQMLHAAVLSFSHPKTGEWLSFTAEPPKEFTKFLEIWDKKITLHS